MRQIAKREQRDVYCIECELSTNTVLAKIKRTETESTVVAFSNS